MGSSYVLIMPGFHQELADFIAIELRWTSVEHTTFFLSFFFNRKDLLSLCWQAGGQHFLISMKSQEAHTGYVTFAEMFNLQMQMGTKVQKERIKCNSPLNMTDSCRTSNVINLTFYYCGCCDRTEHFLETYK